MSVEACAKDEGQPAPSIPGGSKRPPADFHAQSASKTRREESEPSNADILSYMKLMLSPLAEQKMKLIFSRSEETSKEMFGHLIVCANQVDERIEEFENKIKGLELLGCGAGGGRVDEEVRARVSRLETELTTEVRRTRESFEGFKKDATERSKQITEFVRQRCSSTGWAPKRPRFARRPRRPANGAIALGGS